MATVDVSQFDIETLLAGSAVTSVSGFDLDVIYNTPSAAIHVSGLDLTLVTTSEEAPIEVSQFDLEVIYRGRVEDPRIRPWTFTMDAHDYLVIRLGQIETLVYDFRAEQWYTWATGESSLWRAFTGINWLGAGLWSENYGSNVVVGDDGNGALYFLDPLGDTDDDALVGSETPRQFERIATGQIALRGFNAIPCYGVQLLGSVGETSNEDLTAVELLTSDDMGNTYDSQGTITIEPGDYGARVEWLSLGSMRAPGRLFRIVDTGALKRIDSLEMIDG